VDYFQYYKIERRKVGASDFADITPEKSFSFLTFRDEDLMAETTYEYQVTTMYSGGLSSASVSLEGLTTLSEPSTPVVPVLSLSVKGSDNTLQNDVHITMDLSSMDGFKHYDIFRWTFVGGGYEGEEGIAYGHVQHTYADFPDASGVYKYVVKAFFDDGTEIEAEILNITVDVSDTDPQLVAADFEAADLDVQAINKNITLTMSVEGKGSPYLEKYTVQLTAVPTLI